jgi:pimeloyl-ACP methyl ester carboxylesterase
MPSNISAIEPKSGYVSVDKLRLHYLDWGGYGAPIIILHATGFLGRIYRPIAQALRSNGHVYSYDQRGHCDSDQPNLASIGWDRTARDFEDFITAMGLKGARGLGHSAGATAIGVVASRRPDLISRAVLVEPVIVDPADPPRRPSELRERALKRKRIFDSVEAMYSNFEGKPPYDTWRRDILRDYCEFGTRPDDDGKRVLKCSPETEARVYDTARESDGLSRILRCPVPLLILFGEKSESPGLMLADRIVAGAPHRRVVMVPGAGHFIPMEEPDLVTRMAGEFFQDE